MAAADRNVVFYAVEDVEGKPAFDRVAALKKINNLTNAAWVVQAHGTNMAVIVDRKGNADKPSRFRFLRLRDDRPYVLSPTRQLSLVEIEKNHRVTEFTHAVMWDDGYLGVWASRDAPPVKYLSDYFASTSKQHCIIVNLYASDVVQRLKEMEKNGLKKVQAKVRTSDTVQLEADGQLKHFGAFFAAGREAEAVTVDITLSVDRARTRTLPKSVGSETERLARYADLTDRLIVTGKDAQGNTQTINMKEQRILVPLPYDQSFTDKEAYESIEAAREQAEDTDRGGYSLDDAARGD